MVQTELIRGIFFDIQGFSVHDGPGCRTLIFFKGCSLSCAWCSNPEGLNAFREPLYNASKCVFDKFCIHACPNQAINLVLTPEHAPVNLLQKTHPLNPHFLEREGEVPSNVNGDEFIKERGQLLQFNRNLCMDCTAYNCIKACCTGAVRLGGYSLGVEELFTIIQRDRQYWGSEGGITLTGGEPFLQPDFASQLLKKCYDSFIHTAVETCGNVPWDNIERSLNYIDWIFYDLKQIDNRKHTRMTMKGNNLIIDNARRLVKLFQGRIIFRMPVIPGFNDDEANIRQLSDFLNSIEKDEINILPVHHLGKEKYNLVGKDYYTDDLRVPVIEDLQKIQSLFESHGIHCYIGSETPF